MRKKQYLFLSDFDQTLSFNDSGLVLSKLIGVDGFEERVRGLADIHLVQQGGELSYLLLHDPQFRCVRKDHLSAVGKQIRLKENIDLLSDALSDLNGNEFAFHVVSAAPEEVIESALEGIVPADHIHGTRFRYNAAGEIEAIVRLPAGYGKVAVVDELRSEMKIGHDSIVYVGDGSSDVHVMLHVNRLDGLTIAVSENKYLTPIAKRTILSEDASSVLVPMMEDLFGWTAAQIRTFFHSRGMTLQEWDKVRTDTIMLSRSTAPPATATVN
ncbi:MAG TPA: HAD-IB family phosphatase [Bryobacteraceae bacterium]|jgi:HAD superfamily phosphoserine phosphatase-like hydrolase|nr:HAD-IB family phosphatase [Bryobacteraceae bacterium]